MAKNKLYTTPIVCKYKNEWFVFFRYWNQQEDKYITKKISRAVGNNPADTQDLNRIKDLKEREKEFAALREAREIWLKLGWNPILDPEFTQRNVAIQQQEYSEIKNWTLHKAIFHALQYKKLAKKSKYDYKKSVLYFMQAANALYIQNVPVSEITRTHIKAIFAWLDTELQLSAKNYNKRLMHIKSLLSELVEWNAIEYNPAFGLKELPEEKTQKFIPYTDEERLMIKEYLSAVNYRFFVFWATIYFTGNRPDEILSYRVSDINFQTNRMHLQPFSQVVKNKKERFTVIHEKLAEYYREMKLHLLPGNYYIFSDNKTFMPGAKKMRRQVATELWEVLVKQELGINKYMYAGKHTGATAFIKAGASEDNLVDHLAHSSKFITRMYTQEGIEQSKLIISKTPIEF